MPLKKHPGGILLPGGESNTALPLPTETVRPAQTPSAEDKRGSDPPHVREGFVRPQPVRTRVISPEELTAEASVSPRPLFSITEVCDLLGFSKNHVRRQIATGTLRAVRSGDRVLVRRRDLIAFIDALKAIPTIEERQRA